MAAKKKTTAPALKGDLLKGAVAGYLAHKQLKLGLVESLAVGYIVANIGGDKKPEAPAKPKELPAAKTEPSPLKVVPEPVKAGA